MHPLRSLTIFIFLGIVHHTRGLIIVYDAESEIVLDQDLVRVGSIAMGETTCARANVLVFNKYARNFIRCLLNIYHVS